MKTLEQKEQALLNELASYPRLALAYSGGVDSTYLADCAFEVLGANLQLLIADSPSLPRSELKMALDLAKARGWKIDIVKTTEYLDEEYLKNEGDRCFHCKNEIFGQMKAFLKEKEPTLLAHGEIEDDKDDLRAGFKAAVQHHVIAPLQNAHLYKSEIRMLSERRKLPTASKASFACLSSRFPTGTRIQLQDMLQVEKAEEILKERKYHQYRIRHHGSLCRIEVNPSDFDRIITDGTELVRQIKATGYQYVTLDLSGYIMGSSAAPTPKNNYE